MTSAPAVPHKRLVPIDNKESLANPNGVMTPPRIKALSVIANGTTLDWRAKFKRAMRKVCEARGISSTIPARLRCVALPEKGALLVWPVRADDPESFSVQARPGGRKVTVPLREAFRAVQAVVPQGIQVEIPVTMLQSRRYGQCLALHFSHAVFLYKRSRGLATALQPEE